MSEEEISSTNLINVFYKADVLFHFAGVLLRVSVTRRTLFSDGD